ncbi:Beta-xylosidase [Paenibacillus sp. 1_12]|uniref:glycoside hydrolase family 43 protein n=1 Tax=Paenibacillus sp. 1_12 TaxID=1566278 RepID=UPI0008EB18AD|nr:glycoside hydrolase 43 family protein [Paenibacillus sp. 1_12]SFL09035.1 Beta-xylosidase [Paenibacillus sp. 1_12]
MLIQSKAWTSDMGDGTFQNPVLYADYSDLDVIRVADDFFMVASSFAHTPGLPILHSKDMVNWTIVNHVIAKVDLPGYDIPQHGKGIWAPSIRFHDNKFWVFVSTPDEGIFMSTAEDPFGSWSPLHMIKEVKGWIDPCPFWDEDGQAYLVHAFAHSRCGIKNKLNLCRMSPDGKQLLDDGVIVFDGTEHHPVMEGPKMHKRNGYYYLFAPAGGVSTGWQTVLRSKHIWGPYEDAIVLHQGDTTVNGPHQGAWVELESGESWFFHFQDRAAYGRIVHLQPMEWVEDWPLMGIDTNGDGIGEPVLRCRKPNVGHEFPIAVPQTSDDFNKDQLGLQWQWQANPNPEWFSLTEVPGNLRLNCEPLPDNIETLYNAPQLLMQKLPAPTFSASVKMNFRPQQSGDISGLILFGYSYQYLALTRSDMGRPNRLVLVQGDGRGGESTEQEKAAVDFPGEVVYMKVDVIYDAECSFSYSADGVHFEPIGQVFQATEGRWVGAKVGIFAVNKEAAASQGHADYSSFIINSL